MAFMSPRSGLLLASGGLAATTLALLGNSALYCRSHPQSCRLAPPFFSEVASNGSRVTQNLELMLLQCLLALLAVSVALRNYTGQASNAQLLYILLAQPVLIAALAYDRLLFRQLHLVLFYLIILLMACEMFDTWIPLMGVLPSLYLVLIVDIARDASNPDGSPNLSKHRRAMPYLQYSAILLYIGVTLARNAKALGALP